MSILLPNGAARRQTKPEIVSFHDAVEYTLANARIINVTGHVTDTMYHDLAMRLPYLKAQSDKPITLVMNTPGGDIVIGLAIYDMVRELVASGVPVDIVTSGYCMSMGTIILQAASVRKARPNTHFMLHELSMGVSGKLSEHEDEIKHARRLQKVLNGILADRMGRDPKELYKQFNRRDYYIDTKSALEFNLIDEIVGGE